MKDFAKKFYKGKKWQKVRAAYYSSQLGKCERCDEAGEIVHHKIHLTPTNINDPNISLNFKYLELVCRKCHKAEHAEKHNERYRIDSSSNILPPDD